MDLTGVGSATFAPWHVWEFQIPGYHAHSISKLAALLDKLMVPLVQLMYRLSKLNHTTAITVSCVI